MLYIKSTSTQIIFNYYFIWSIIFVGEGFHGVVLWLEGFELMGLTDRYLNSFFAQSVGKNHFEVGFGKFGECDIFEKKIIKKMFN